MTEHRIYWLQNLQPGDRQWVGDKAFLLGGLMNNGYPVQPGVIISAQAFREFLEQLDWLEPLFVDFPTSSLHLDVDNAQQLQAIASRIHETLCRGAIPSGWMPEIVAAIENLTSDVVALRPSLFLPPHTPLYGEQLGELFEDRCCWNTEAAIAHGLKHIWAELFRARNLVFWQRMGLQPQRVNLAILIQPLSPAIASGDICNNGLITQVRSSWGLPHGLWRGEISPDQYQIDSLTGQVQSHQPGDKPYRYQVLIPTSAAHATHDQIPLSEPPPCLDLQDVPSGDRHTDSLNTHQLQQLLTMTRPLLKSQRSVRFEWLLVEDVDSSDAASIYVTRLIRQAQTNPPKPNLKSASPSVSQPPSTPASSLRQPADSPSPDPVSSDLDKPGDSEAEPVSELRTPNSELRTRSPRLTGLAAAPGQVSAQAWVMDGSNSPNIPKGRILIADNITPDWLPWLQQSAGIITEQGGLTCHGAILARELGLPAIVGVANVACQIQTGDWLQLDGDRGVIHRLNAAPTLPLNLEASQLASPAFPSNQIADPPATSHLNLEAIASDANRSHPSRANAHAPLSTPTDPFRSRPHTHTQLLVNLSQPDQAAMIAAYPVDGVGLLRSEIMLVDFLSQHPLDYWHFPEHQQPLLDCLVDRLGAIARAFSPRPVLYRALELRSHEFSRIPEFEAPETNPILGLHGTFSYRNDPTLFNLQLLALRQLQDNGITNLRLLLPFVRAVEEFTFCRQSVTQAGLFENPDFQLWIMAEVPSISFLLPDFVQAGVQGISIGSNDLSQLLFGADRDLPELAATFDSQHPAMMRVLYHLITTAKQSGIPCSICGHAPSQFPDLIDALVSWGISSISVTPDAIERSYQRIAQVEQKIRVRSEE